MTAGEGGGITEGDIGHHSEYIHMKAGGVDVSFDDDNDGDQNVT